MIEKVHLECPCGASADWEGWNAHARGTQWAAMHANHAGNPEADAMRSRITELEDELVQLAGLSCSWTMVSFEESATFGCVLGSGHTGPHDFGEMTTAAELVWGVAP